MINANKYWLVTVIVVLTMSTVFSQQTINATLTHDNLTREYILYVPASYDGNNPVPLVFNFHGYTSTAFEQMNYGDFRKIADEENFIIAHPMGTIGDDGEPYFNAQWVADGADDIGFTGALIDTISSNWNINLDRVYSTGMSNGGFMSYTLACELSDRIAAIASVTGTMTLDQLNNTCNPENLTPIMEIHGTSDFVVPYTGNNFMAPTEAVIDFWVNKNQCDNTPSVRVIDDSAPLDGSTAEHYLYQNGLEGHEVEHYKIIGGGHTWPGTFFGNSNRDINASELIWEFFSKYDLDGKITTSNQNTETENQVLIYPNPSNGSFNIQSENFSKIENIILYDQNGRVVFQQDTQLKNVNLNINIDKGLYFLKVEINSEVLFQKIIIK